ncbi:hypothetical protein FSP39_004890 [Pinctada imbricata]|uniref:Uncharacterized protein n=1 Tax=Pinctada imbricata TaxID=66713 RepID=A0AA88YUV4_PINIB|nr:hypothetical protein FSP39_004890 [Pinctada imbricata]
MDSASINLKVSHEATFSIKCPEDEEDNGITGIISLSSGDVIVADNQNNVLKLFDSDGIYTFSAQDPQYTMGITEMSGEDFATCGWDREIFFWTVRDQKIVQLDGGNEVEHDADGIRYNGENFVVLHRFDNAITILDNEGSIKDKLVVKEAFGKRINFGFEIQLDIAGNIYLPCVEESKGVLCLSLEGDCLWHCELPGNVGGLTFINAVMCVVSTDLKCVHLIDSTSGSYLRDIIGKTDLEEDPSNICYSHTSGNLYLTFNVWGKMKEKVSVFSIS